MKFLVKLPPYQGKKTSPLTNLKLIAVNLLEINGKRGQDRFEDMVGMDVVDLEGPEDLEVQQVQEELRGLMPIVESKMVANSMFGQKSPLGEP